MNSITEMYERIASHPESVVRELERQGSSPAELRFVVGDLDEVLRGRISLVEQLSGVAFYRESVSPYERPA